jgi:hypothetical protein
VKRLNPTWEKQQAIERKAKPGKYDLVDLIFFVGGALIFDVFSFIPGVGTLGMVAARLAFSIKNVNTKLINILTGAGGLAELIPFLSFLPSVTFFVTIVFVEVKFMELAVKKLSKVSPVAGQIAKTAIDQAEAGAGVASGKLNAGAATAGKEGLAQAGQTGQASASGSNEVNSTEQAGGSETTSSQGGAETDERSQSENESSAQSPNEKGESAESSGSDMSRQHNIGREYEGATGKDIGQRDSRDAMDGPTDENRAEADSGKGGRFPSEDPVITKRETDSANDQPINENKKSPVASTEKLDKEKNPKKSEPDSTDHLI